MVDRNFVLVLKESNAKKEKVIAARNLTDCSPNLPLKTGKQKRKSKFFYRVLPDACLEEVEVCFLRFY
jgi:hypothetical protein